MLRCWGQVLSFARSVTTLPLSRPLRIELAGGLYHVASRGDGREAIFLSEEDRSLFLAVLSEVFQDFNRAVHDYCLMDIHYHLLIETPDGNLSGGMPHAPIGGWLETQALSLWMLRLLGRPGEKWVALFSRRRDEYHTSLVPPM